MFRNTWLSMTLVLALSAMPVPTGICALLGDELSDADAVRVSYRVLTYCAETLHYTEYGQPQEEALKTRLTPLLGRSFLNTYMAAFKERYRPYFAKSVFMDEDGIAKSGGKHEAQKIIRGKGATPGIVVTINDDNGYAGESGYGYTFTLTPEDSDSGLLKYRVWRVTGLSIAPSRD